MLRKEYGAEASGLLAQVPRLQFDKRQLTGTGYYLHFSPDNLTPTECQNNDVTEFVETHLSKPQHTVGFTLFIRDGRLSSFEGYTFGDVRWPSEPMEKWIEPAATRNKAG